MAIIIDKRMIRTCLSRQEIFVPSNCAYMANSKIIKAVCLLSADTRVLGVGQ